MSNKLKNIVCVCFCFIAFTFLNKLDAQTETAKDSITVYFFLGEDCRICQYYAPLLNQLDSIYNSDYVSLIGLFPSRYSTEDGIEKFQDNHKISFPLKREFYGTKAKKFGAKITPEVFVYNETTSCIIYSGRIDNAYARIGKRRRVVTKHELADVLSSLAGGEEVEPHSTESIGCFISLRD